MTKMESWEESFNTMLKHPDQLLEYFEENNTFTHYAEDINYKEKRPDVIIDAEDFDILTSADNDIYIADISNPGSFVVVYHDESTRRYNILMHNATVLNQKKFLSRYKDYIGFMRCSDTRFTNKSHKANSELVAL